MTLKILILAICFLFSHLSKSDTCFKSFETDTAQAQAIFVGKVVKMENGLYWYRGDHTTVFTFEVIESFKGLRQDVGYISLVGPINGCCNEHFEKDSVFLVFGYNECKDTKFLWTNDCSNTGLLSKQKINYHRLGIPLKHTVTPEDSEYFKQHDPNADSLVGLINKSELDIVLNRQQINRSEKQRLIFLSIIVVLIVILGAIKLRKK